MAPDAQKMLAKLSLGLPGSILSDPQLFSVCAIDFDNRIERFYQRHYINMDRKKFDSWLISYIVFRRQPISIWVMLQTIVNRLPSSRLFFVSRTELYWVGIVAGDQDGLTKHTL